MKMVITDLDGTLLDSRHQLSSINRKTLERLPYKGVTRVVATGRSVYSAYKVMEADFPLDYLIFSTGAGILDWKIKEVIYKNVLEKTIVSDIIDILIQNDVSFMLHQEIPDNHYFYYMSNGMHTDDFASRLMIYSNYAQSFDYSKHKEIQATQLICMFEEIDSFIRTKEMLDPISSGLSLIQATSPLNNKSVWLEIFSAGVNKSNAAKQLAGMLNIRQSETISIGNDWNDEDLLTWTKSSYVVANSPDELKERFTVVGSNDENGFTEAVNMNLR